MGKRLREEKLNPSDCLRSIDEPKRGRGRPRKSVTSPVTAPLPSQVERSSSKRPSRERRSLRNKPSSPVATPPPEPKSHFFFKIFFTHLSSQKIRIPPAFREHINTKFLGKVSLRGPSGYKWKVNLVRSSKDFYFETGWEKFVSDHSLETGDMLLFREQGNNNFSVHVFDKSACEKESAFEVTPNQGVKSPEEPDNCLAIVKKEPNDFSYSRPLVVVKTEPVENTAQPAKYFNWLRNIPGPLVEVKRKRTQAVISQRRAVTQEEIGNALERARAFQSEKPFIIIVMRNSYVYASFFMAIRSEFVKEHLPKHNTKLTLLDPSGRSWPIQYVCYQGRNGAFSGGWARAAVENNLELHDAVVFELIQRNQFQMHIFRVVEEITPFKRGSKIKY